MLGPNLHLHFPYHFLACARLRQPSLPRLAITLGPQKLLHEFNAAIGGRAVPSTDCIPHPPSPFDALLGALARPYIDLRLATACELGLPHREAKAHVTHRKSTFKGCKSMTDDAEPRQAAASSRPRIIPGWACMVCALNSEGQARCFAEQVAQAWPSRHPVTNPPADIPAFHRSSQGNGSLYFTAPWRRHD